MLIIFLLNRVYLTESPSPYSITVLRDKGTFGQAQVNYYVVINSANRDDFNITGGIGPEVTLVFPDAVNKQDITIYAFDDSLSEGDEKFEIGLVRNSPGTAIGNHSTLTVVIRANDDAYGVFNLTRSSLSKTISEPGTGPVSEAEFEIVRSVDSYGTVVVFWEVLNGSADLSPVSGNVTFADGVTRKTFKVKALLDSTPEKAETYVIKLNISGELKSECTSIDN